MISLENITRKFSYESMLEAKRCPVTDTSNLVGLTYLDENWLNEIRDTVDEEHLEYQVFYNSLQLIWKVEEAEFVLNIPLCFYSHKQTISYASINFDLEDVENECEQHMEVTEILSNVVLNNVKPILGKIGEVLESNDLSVKISKMNSIHRHPTGIRSFSSTDLKRVIMGKNQLKEDNAGVVYILNDAHDRAITFADIMYHKTKESTGIYDSLIHYVTGSCDDETLAYEKGRTFTVVKPTKESKIDRVLGLNYNTLPHKLDKIYGFLLEVDLTPTVVSVCKYDYRKLNNTLNTKDK